MPDDNASPPSYRPPDAILVDREFPSGFQDIEKHQQRNRIFGPVFGCTHTQWGHSGAGFTRSLGRPKAADTSLGRYHGQGHPEAGGDRYSWFVARKDGNGKDAKYVPVLPLAEGEPEPVGEVLFGYLKPDAHSDAATAAATKKAIDERIEAARDTEEARAEWKIARSEGRFPPLPGVPEQSDKANTPIEAVVEAPPKKVQKP